jgi:formamidopyrimidine-DNA glycosylase
MPELPEVETVRRLLIPSIVGHTLLGIEPRDFADVMGGLDIAQASAAVAGARITSVDRRAKYLFIHLDTGDALIVHLRMTGRLLVVPASAPSVRFEHLAIKLDGDLDSSHDIGEVARFDADNGVTDDARGEQAADRFDFGKLWHRLAY